MSNPTIQPLCTTCLRRTGCINVTDDCTACLHYSPVSGAVRPTVCDLECKFSSDSFNGCSEWARVESCEKWQHMRGAKKETVAAGGMIRGVEEVVNGGSSVSDYAVLGHQIGELVTRKQAAYGDSFGKTGSVMRILYPDGIALAKLDDALTVVRVLDKLFRIATDRDALGESPWRDVAGYALLSVARVEGGNA